MTEEKLEALKALIGEEGIAAILSQVQETQKQADGQGVAFKEAAEPTTQPEMTPAAVASFITAPVESTTTASSNADGKLTFTVEATVEPDEEAPLYAGDMLPNELVSLITGQVVQAITPLFGGMVEAVKALGASTNKDADIALLQEQQARKDAENAAARKVLQDQAAALATQLKEVKEKLDELSGEQPRAVQQGYRASQQNPIGDNHRLKEVAPVGGLDPNFFGFLSGNGSQLPPQ